MVTFLKSFPGNGFFFAKLVSLSRNQRKKRCAVVSTKKEPVGDQLSHGEKYLLEGHFRGFLLSSFGFIVLLFGRWRRFSDLFFFQAVDVNRVIMAEVVGVLQFCDFQGNVIFVVVFVGELDDV